MGKLRKSRKVYGGPGPGRPSNDHPTTTDVEYTAAEVEFMLALDRFKRERRRPFPTTREILAVLLSLGYQKVTQPGATDGNQDDAGRAA